ncbi:MAG: hypothetical protein AB4911_14760 [Oscillochloridaceae bacterium umkhey_bin13]
MQAAKDNCGMGEQCVEQQIDCCIILDAPNMGQVQWRKVGRQVGAGLLERQQVSVGLRQHDQGLGGGGRGSGIGLRPLPPGSCPLAIDS